MPLHRQLWAAIKEIQRTGAVGGHALDALAAAADADPAAPAPPAALRALAALAQGPAAEHALSAAALLWPSPVRGRQVAAVPELTAAAARQIIQHAASRSDRLQPALHIIINHFDCCETAEHAQRTLGADSMPLLQAVAGLAVQCAEGREALAQPAMIVVWQAAADGDQLQPVLAGHAGLLGALRSALADDRLSNCALLLCSRLTKQLGCAARVAADAHLLAGIVAAAIRGPGTAPRIPGLQHSEIALTTLVLCTVQDEASVAAALLSTPGGMRWLLQNATQRLPARGAEERDADRALQTVQLAAALLDLLFRLQGGAVLTPLLLRERGALSSLLAQARGLWAAPGSGDGDGAAAACVAMSIANIVAAALEWCPTSAELQALLATDRALPAAAVGLLRCATPCAQRLGAAALSMAVAVEGVRHSAWAALQLFVARDPGGLTTLVEMLRGGSGRRAGGSAAGALRPRSALLSEQLEAAMSAGLLVLLAKAGDVAQLVRQPGLIEGMVDVLERQQDGSGPAAVCLDVLTERGGGAACAAVLAACGGRAAQQLERLAASGAAGALGSAQAVPAAAAAAARLRAAQAEAEATAAAEGAAAAEAAAAAAPQLAAAACAHCGKTASQVGRAKLKVCAGCHSARFCSEQCYAATWKAGHRAACAALQREQQARGLAAARQQ